MKKLEEAATYDCPTKFTIVKCNAGWTKIECDFNGEIIEFYISYLGDQPSTLLETAYYLNSNYDDNDELLDINIDDDEAVFDQEGNEGWMTSLGVRFVWNEEPQINNWHITYAPEDFGKEDYDLTIEIEHSTGLDGKFYKFTVPYRDYCYAVAECFTNVLKEHGFYGYGLGSYTDYIVVKRLLLVKAYALGLLGNRTSADPGHGDSYNLSFEEELKLLVMDM